jgi:peptidoglycan/LPS O-acetylase OafA/YrhL
LKPEDFNVGYLGVDIFFAISGYLMCSILSRKCPLDLGKIRTFYLQRLKRIVPIYLFVILLTLLCAIWLFLHPMDYKELDEESWKPLIFAANIPSEKTVDYFDRVKIRTFNKY